MAAIPTYIYVGDPQINGGYTLPPTGFPELWGFYNNYPRFSRVVPSGADGATGGLFEPYWDGSMASGAGAFTKYAHAANTLFTPGANGDNWYLTGGLGGGVSPCTLLMNALWERHPLGFKMLKLSVNGGFGAGVEQLKVGGTGYTMLRAEWDAMVAAMAPDEPDLKCVIVDATVTDIVAGSFTYVADIESFIGGIRSDYSSDCLILLVSHHKNMRPSVTGGGVPLFNLARSFNRTIAQTNDNVRLFDMQWAEFGADSFGTIVPADNIQYRVRDYIDAGARMGRQIDAYFTAAPDATAGKGIATYVMIGDSNFVVAGSNATLPSLSQQESLLGPVVGSTQRAGQYIWNEQTQTIELYDVLANACTFGDVSSNYGPELTLLKRLHQENPDGVLLMKFAQTGISLSLEGLVFGAPAAAELAAGTVFESVQEGFAALTLAAVRDLGRTVDLRGIVVSLGGNDAYQDYSTTAFAAKIQQYVDDLRSVLVTRTNGGEVPLVWLQPPPHAETVSGGTVFGEVANRESVRATVAALPAQKEAVDAVLDPGGLYELQRGELIHYAAEAIYDIGYALAEKLIALESGEGAAEAAETSDLPSGSATFTVESGSGSSSANSYATVAYADTYHQTFGNPSLWINATQPAKQDALRIATQFLDLHYGSRWVGARATSEQALDWPRLYVIDSAGNDVGADEIPVRLQQATAKAALLHLQGNTLIASTLDTAEIASESKSLPGGLSKSVSYIGGKPATTSYPVVDRMLTSASLIEAGAGWGYSDV